MRRVLTLLLALGLAPGLIGLGGLNRSRVLAQAGAGAATKQNLDLPFDAVGNQEEEEEAPEVIVFWNGQYEGDFFAFVVDKSSSSAPVWTKIQSETAQIVRGFSERVQFGIVFFDATPVKFPPTGRPADANAAMKGAAQSMIMSTQTGHGSCYKEALIAALTFSQQSTAKRKQIIVLGDGEAYCNGVDVAQYSKETLSTVASRNTQRAHVNTIGYSGTGGINEEFLRALANQNNGSFRRG
jgi:hypothetical protein